MMVTVKSSTKASITHFACGHCLANVVGVDEGYTVMDPEFVIMGNCTGNLVQFQDFIILARSLGPSGKGAQCLWDKGCGH